MKVDVMNSWKFIGNCERNWNSFATMSQQFSADTGSMRSSDERLRAAILASFAADQPPFGERRFARGRGTTASPTWLGRWRRLSEDGWAAEELAGQAPRRAWGSESHRSSWSSQPGARD